MKKAGILMNVFMSVSMSLCLSFTGMMTSGQFTVPGFLRSFAVSLVISFVLGLIVSIPRLNAAAARKYHLKRGAMKTRLIEALIADMVYSPLMGFIMITLAWFSAHSHGAKIPYLPMLLKGLAVSIVVGYVLSFVLVPLFMKIAFRNVQLPPEGPPAEKPEE